MVSWTFHHTETGVKFCAYLEPGLRRMHIAPFPKPHEPQQVRAAYHWLARHDMGWGSVWLPEDVINVPAWLAAKFNLITPSLVNEHGPVQITRKTLPPRRDFA